MRSTILLIDDDPFQAYAHRTALERSFTSIERAADASEALILVDDPAFAGSLALIIVGLCMPGLSGPALVGELSSRIPSVPILVIGRAGESAADYTGQNVRYLPRFSSTGDFLAGARALFSPPLARVA